MSARRAAVAGLLATVLLLPLPLAAPRAQERIRVVGTVQWVASTTLQLMTPSGAMSIDLTRVDQSSYQALRQGDVVTVDGIVASDRRRVLAADIRRDRGGVEAP